MRTAVLARQRGHRLSMAELDRQLIEPAGDDAGLEALGRSQLAERDFDRRFPRACSADENDVRRCDVSARIIAQPRAVLPPPDEGCVSRSSWSAKGQFLPSNAPRISAGKGSSKSPVTQTLPSHPPGWRISILPASDTSRALGSPRLGDDDLLARVRPFNQPRERGLGLIQVDDSCGHLTLLGRLDQHSAPLGAIKQAVGNQRISRLVAPPCRIPARVGRSGQGDAMVRR
jgi:hypothetical protein